MKRLTTILMLLLAVALQVMGQSPRKFSYQAVVRNADGTILSNQQVMLKVSIVAETGKETPYFTEVHSITTTPYGTVNLVVGDGAEPTGSLDDIPWADGNLNVQIDLKLGTADYIPMGTTRVLAVPYALYAATGTPGEKGPQGDPGIPILWLGSLAAAPTTPSLNQAYYNTVDKTSYVYNGTAWSTLAKDGTDGQAGADGIGILWKGNLDVAPTAPLLNWAYYNNVDKKSYIYNGTEWTTLAQDGAQGPAGPMVTGTAGQMLTHDGTNWVATNRTKVTSETFEIRPAAGHDPEQPIFAVYNSQSKLAFAVYEKGTRVYVEDEAKGSKGGFAVGGLTPAKLDKPATEVVYMKIYPDSVRFNIVETPENSGKGSKGGFAVGGLTPAKSEPTNDYLNLSFDQARFTIRDDGNKTSKGGFAIGGLTPGKAGELEDFFMVSMDSTYIANTLIAAGDIAVQGNMTTGGTVGTLPVKDKDGNEYKTVRIGNQIWMQENLRTTKYADGTAIGVNALTDLTGEELSGLGRLYNETAVYNSANGGICPTGWHVPSYIDWLELLTFVGGANWSTNAVITGNKLIEKNSTYWTVPDANNISGFTGRPGGFYNLSTTTYIEKGTKAYWWNKGAVNPELYSLDAAGGIISIPVVPAAGNAYSVRCIKDIQ